jgi:hypothetical protein
MSTWLRYEDLVRNPTLSIRDALAEVDLGSVDRLPLASGRQLSLGVNHTVSGNPMRFQTGITDIKPDDEWKNKMKSADKAITTLLTSALLMRYGYLAGSRSPSFNKKTYAVG